MKDFILIKSDKSFGSVMALSVVDRYLAELDLYLLGYTARWRLFPTPDYLIYLI